MNDHDFMETLLMLVDTIDDKPESFIKANIVYTPDQ